MRTSWRRPLVVILAVLAAGSAAGTGCVSARMSDRQIDRSYLRGDYVQAVEYLEKGLKEQGEHGKDRLLYLLDLGVAQHMAGMFQQSIQTLHEADRLAEIKDYTSIAAEAATLLVSDNTKDFRAEEFENVLISAFLALNYAGLGQWDEAVIEARRVNRKLYMLITEGKRPYALSAFAEYFAAVLYEAEGEWNDALVSYKKARTLAPEWRQIGADWWRMARRLGMPDEMERAEQAYRVTREERKQWQEDYKHTSKKGGKGEVIVVFESGRAPLKHSHAHFHEIPVFVGRSAPPGETQLVVDDKDSASIAVLHDIEASAIQNLQEKYAGLIAKKIAGRVTKYAIGQGVRHATDSPLLGLAAEMLLVIADQADLRSWSLLPRDLALGRAWVEPGTRRVQLRLSGGRLTPEQTVEVVSGKKTIVFVREQ